MSNEESKNNKPIPDTKIDMDVPIDKQIEDKRKELVELGASLSIYMSTHHPPQVVAKVQELQNRLEFRTKKYEIQLLDEKIGIYKECLTHVKPTE